MFSFVFSSIVLKKRAHKCLLFQTEHKWNLNIVWILWFLSKWLMVNINYIPLEQSLFFKNSLFLPVASLTSVCCCHMPVVLVRKDFMKTWSGATFKYFSWPCSPCPWSSHLVSNSCWSSWYHHILHVCFQPIKCTAQRCTFCCCYSSDSKLL